MFTATAFILSRRPSGVRHVTAAGLHQTGRRLTGNSFNAPTRAQVRLGPKETGRRLNYRLVLCVIVGNGKRAVGMSMSGSEDATFR